jgi:hypothetical protein
MTEISKLAPLGAIVKGDITLCGKGISSLHDIHKILNEVDGFIHLQDNPIKSDALSLLKIKKLKGVYMDNKALQEIINKHLPEGDLFDCQEELIDADLGDYAAL